MSAWDIIEGIITAQPVALPLVRRELLVVREAHAAWLRRVLEESSAWDILERIGLLTEEDMTAAIKGLSPREIQVIGGVHKGAPLRPKPGHTGEVVALTPREWQSIRQEIESNPEYYDWALGDRGAAGNLSKKIGDRLSLEMGQPPPAPGHAGEPGPGGKPAPTIGSKTPFSKKTGAGGSPEERRRRVAAQDAAMMGGQTKPVGKVKIQGEKVEGNKLIKKTTRPGSISLEQDEYEGIMSGQIEFVDVLSMAGKLVKSLTGAQVKGNILKGLAGVRQVDDDPTKPSYWYVRI